MIRVGITGGIGVGKTTVSKLFKELDVPVFNSDLCARESESNPEIQKAIQEIIHENIFVDGKLDRAEMRKIIFNDKNKLIRINKAITPYIKARFEEFCVENKHKRYVILESAILFETGANGSFDIIITVTADTNIRIKRAMARDNSTLEDVEGKLRNQWPEDKKIAASDYIIFNNGTDLIDSLDILTKQVKALDKAIMWDWYTT